MSTRNNKLVIHISIDGLSPKKVGNIKNLQFIPHKENIAKGSKITTESKNALRRIRRLK